MALSRKFSQLALVILLTTALASSAQAALLETRPFTPDAAPEIWTNEDLFPFDDFFVLTPDFPLEKIAREKGVTGETLDQLLKHSTRVGELPPSTQDILGAHGMIRDDKQLVLLLPSEFLKKLPLNLIGSFYFDEVEAGLRRLTLPFESERDFRSYLRSHGASKDTIEGLVKFLAKDGKATPRLLLTKENWKLLPESARNEALEEFSNRKSSNPGKRGLAVNLVIQKDDDLHALAVKYSAGRDPAAIEKLLRKKLGKKPSTQIPLEAILPSYIRKNLNRFTPCHGPNCFNTVLNTGRNPREQSREYTSMTELTQELGSKYRFVQPGEQLQVGDVLLYYSSTSEAGEVVHTSTYVGDDLVFTKNGRSRYAPFLFQHIDTNENFYQVKPQNHNLSVFRLAKTGETLARQTPADEIPVYERPPSVRPPPPASPNEETCGGMMSDLKRRALDAIHRSR